MEITIFYSWQSDLPNSTNRGFIETALKQAAESIHTDETIKVEPVIDRDTSGVPGSPDIASTIFAKIEQSHIFVCDVSIINQASNSRKTPNPNVLIELGYAMKKLGHTRIIMILNNAYGGMELLPFDLRLRRVIPYHMPESERDRATERKKLRGKLESALRMMFKTEENFPQDESPSQIAEQARYDIENSTPRQTLSVRKLMECLINEINSFAPDFSSEEEHDDLLITSIANTEKLVFEFARTAQVIAAVNSEIVAEEVFKNFAPILEKYRPPRGFSGTWYPADFDYYKFLGHELLICLMSPLIRDGRWNIVTKLLEQGIYVDNGKIGQAGLVNFDYFSHFLATLANRNDRLNLNRVSVHADLINERHTEGLLREIIPMEQFIDADFFLFLREGFGWKPWSTIYLRYDKVPRFLVEAVSRRYVQNLFAPLKVENVDSLKELIVERVGQLRQLFRATMFIDPLEDFDLRTLGSRD